MSDSKPQVSQVMSAVNMNYMSGNNDEWLQAFSARGNVSCQYMNSTTGSNYEWLQALRPMTQA